MPNVNRFRRADAKRVLRLPVDAPTVIEVGDLIWQATDGARPASSFPFVAGSLARTQANFRRDFVGVAMKRSDAGDTEPITVASRGVFELNCAPATFEVGDRVGPAGAGGMLLNQEVVALSENAHGEIGKVAKRYPANTTRVLVEIDSLMLRPNVPQIVWLFEGSTTTAGDLVSDWSAEFPYKLVAVHAVVTAAYTGTDTITLRNGVNALDDTVALTGGAGTVIRTTIDDALGRDRYLAQDTLDIATNGLSTSGSALIGIEIVPFLHHD